MEEKSDDTSGRRMSHKRALARSRSIDQQLNEERERREREVQLLVLGGGGSGKSTFLKQLRLHYGDHFPQEELNHWKIYIYQNLVDGIHVVIDNMKVLNRKFENSKSQTMAEELARGYPRMTYFHLAMTTENGVSSAACSHNPERRKGGSISEVPSQVYQLWADKDFQICYKDRQNFAERLSHSERYYLSEFDRITKPTYSPTIKDVLYVRKPTQGVQELTFTVDELQYRVIDVAGQKSQRTKWIHFFDGVTAVMFFASLSGFDENLEEDDDENNLRDSLQTFSDVTHNQYLQKTDIILFLNKHDLLIEKLKTKKLNHTFPEYKGNNEPDDCVKFIKNEFEKCGPKGKKLYSHVSCAVNVDLMKKIIDDILQIVVEINLRKAGPL